MKKYSALADIEIDPTGKKRIDGINICSSNEREGIASIFEFKPLINPALGCLEPEYFKESPQIHLHLELKQAEELLKDLSAVIKHAKKFVLK